MKVIYEVSDSEIDKSNLCMHKYADDMYFALYNIESIINGELNGNQKNDKQKLMDMIKDEIFNSKIHEIR